MKKNKFEKNDVFIQARLNSTRFPKKILKTISNKTILQIIVERTKQIENIDKIVLVTGPEKLNSELFQEADRLGMQVFFGDEENVLDRFESPSVLPKKPLIPALDPAKPDRKN